MKKYRIILVLLWSLFLCSSAFAGVQLKSFSLQGKWIDAREHGSYYASFGSLIMDDKGVLHLFFAGSGKDYVEGEWPEWQKDSKYSTDKILYSQSTDGGATWSKSKVLIQAAIDSRTGKEKTEQAACANSVVYFKGYYYLFFESYTTPTYMIAIHVARSKNIDGPYDIWTDNGTGNGQWSRTDIDPKRPGSTLNTWKPVIEPKLLRLATGEKYAEDVAALPNNALGHVYYGAGCVSAAVVKNDENGSPRLYLYYIDTTHDAKIVRDINRKIAILFPAELGYNWYVYGPDGKLALKDPNRPMQLFPVNLVSSTTDGVTFNAVDEKELWDPSPNINWRLCGIEAVTYSAQDNIFISLSTGEVGVKAFTYPNNNRRNSLNSNKQMVLLARTSIDGINWGQVSELATLPYSYSGNARIAVNPLGQLNPPNYPSPKLSDTYLYLARNYRLQNRFYNLPYPTPYEGGTNLYGFKLGLKTSPSDPEVIAVITESDHKETPYTQFSGFDSKAVYITETNRYSSNNSSSGFYVSGTGFKDNVYAAVRWVKPGDPSGKLGEPIYYIKRKSPTDTSPYYITSWLIKDPPVGGTGDYYHDSDPYHYAAFIPLSAQAQDLFNHGWQAFFTLYNVDTGSCATVNMTPAGKNAAPVSIMQCDFTYRGLFLSGTGIPASAEWASLRWDSSPYSWYYLFNPGDPKTGEQYIDEKTRLRTISLPVRAISPPSAQNAVITVGQGDEHNNNLARVPLK